MTLFHLGLAVWGFDRWAGSFMPSAVRKADMLRRYAERMDCVEGNDSFYGVPSSTTLERRARETPRHFRFCPKLPRSISHEGRLAPQAAAAVDFAAHMHAGLGERLGPFFLQLPPSYGPADGPDLARLLNTWRRRVEHPLLVEVRHPDWYTEQFGPRLDTLLSRLRLSRVVLDTRPIYSGGDDPQADNPRKKPKLPLHAQPVSGRSMVRFISHPDPRRNERYLAEWAERVQRWLEQEIEVFFFVHCPDDAFSPDTARRFHRMLTARGAPVAPLGWDQVPAEPVQAGLFGAGP